MISSVHNTFIIFFIGQKICCHFSALFATTKMRFYDLHTFFWSKLNLINLILIEDKASENR